MKIMREIMKIIDVVVWHPFFMIPDDIFLKIKYYKKKRKKLDLKNPVLLSEKVQWLKLYDRNPNWPNLVDKYEVRKVVAEAIGEKHLIPIYGVWETFDEIPFDKLPDRFVLKCTHDSGSIIICKDKKTLNIAKARRFFNRRLVHNYYWQRREWVYKNIKPRIIAEKLMVDESGIDLKDYKLYCFNGEPKIINVIFDRFAKENEKAKENFYSPQWECLPMASAGHVSDPSAIEKPECLGQMLDFARKLAAGKIHVRVDFYIVHNHIYFGEFTFYSCGGYECFEPPYWDKTLGDYMVLPKTTP
jgi:hypothetical protein